MNTERITLSKNILQMKFMKRTKEKVEKQQFQEEGELYFGSRVMTRMKKQSERFIVEPSYAFCEGLVSGRMSFQGMNPVIEKYMESIQQKEKLQEEESQPTDVSDEQMAVQWQRIKGKFNAMPKRKNLYYNEDEKNGPVAKKTKFLKPVD
ncbi:PREDICTED: M-phase phosphoprotein 6 [Dinoponera quadriceps]|uniref:M-phase phosphoprotein 6 n=1 Tax=Dinoponera quadriceps TaxID=609295 RepID=A0A6P3YH33_DINQU|nr:PREDICTED: M-phase phosphoprotein 6 [Dinoponera quadriceps]